LRVRTAIISVSLLPTLLVGCFFSSGSVTIEEADSALSVRSSRLPFGRRGLPIPTKDDVALVDGEAVTLGDFVSARDVMADKSRDAVLWASIGARIIEGRWRKRAADPTEPSAPKALELARYALNEMPRDRVEVSLRSFYGLAADQPLPDPPRLRRDVDAWVAAAVVQKNIQALAELR
jgi:hypothetical protein